ncbi:rCG49645 [Rattus norvegicus]|uniref:RCG49645 n=1 Tax=Rattus norvegicus TaxID=10116 RepID=A6K2G9_RAT|nr:rCG49645 [Rattus norvegicus]
MILDTLALEFVDGEPILSPLQEQQVPFLLRHPRLTFLKLVEQFPAQSK